MPSGVIFCISITLVLLRRSSSTFVRMQAIRNDGIGGRGVTLIPHGSGGAYSNVVVFMHGLGDTADGWASMMPSLGLKNTKFILPTADSRPIVLNGGVAMPGWSNIYGLDSTTPEDKEGFDQSAARVQKIVQLEVDKGVDPKRIVIGGFSQGGALALHFALRSPLSLGGCLALSTWLPLRVDYPAALSPSANTLKIEMFHGTADPVVDYSWGEGSYKLLCTLLPDNPPILHSIKGMGHSSDPDEIRQVKIFLTNVFAD